MPLDPKLEARHRGTKVIGHEPTSKEIQDPKTGTLVIDPQGDEMSGDGKADAIFYDAPPPVFEENPDPMKRRIRRFDRRSRWVKWVVNKSPWRELTKEELEDKQEMQRRRDMEKLLRDESNLYIQRIKNALTRNNLCYRYKKSETDFFVSRVKEVDFSHVVMSPDAIYLKVATDRLPRGVKILDIVDDKTILTDLSLACGHTVTSFWKEDRGAWLIVERAAGVRGIPRNVDYDALYRRIPKNADTFTIPLGLGVNSKPEFYSLVDMPHLLVAGATDTGKSNMVNVIITTLAKRNTIDNLRFVMIDLKGGLELSFYEDLPHMLPIDGITDTGIVYEFEQVRDLLEWVLKEGRKRITKIKQAEHKNIKGYNRGRRKGRMSRLVLVIDEWAEIRLVASLGKKAEEKLARITSTLRAAGVHVILATQSPKVEVISTLIKNNLPARMAFGCSDNTSSMLIIDTAEAKGLTPQGRMIFRKGINAWTLQAPEMPNKMIREIVAELKAQGTGGDDSKVTEVDLVLYSLNELGGSLSKVKLWDEFKDRISLHDLENMLISMDDLTFPINESLYQVIPSNGGNIPRHLEDIGVPVREISEQ